MRQRRSLLEGPRLLALSSAVLAGIAGGIVAAGGAGEDGVRTVIRTTARTSALLFTAAFVASSAHALLHADATAWLLRNRRWVGLSFAVSHAIHLAAIAALATWFPASYRGVSVVTRAGGTLGVLALAALVATSNDRAVRALGGRRWRALHRSSVWILWTVFAVSTMPAIATASGAPWALLVLAGAGLRLAAWAAARPHEAQGAAARSSPPTSSSGGQ